MDIENVVVQTLLLNASIVQLEIFMIQDKLIRLFFYFRQMWMRHAKPMLHFICKHVFKEKKNGKEQDRKTIIGW